MLPTRTVRMIPVAIVLGISCTISSCAEPDATAGPIASEFLQPVSHVVQTLSKNLGSLTPAQQDALAEGLYLVYGVRRTPQDLLRLRKTLRELVAVSKTFDELGRRCAVLAQQFDALDMRQSILLNKSLGTKMTVVRLAHADVLGGAGQYKGAIGLLLSEKDLPHFTLLSFEGHQALLKELISQGQEKGASAASIYRASAYCLEMDMAYARDLAHGIQRLYRNRSIAVSQTEQLIQLQAKMARDLLGQRDSVAHGAIGYALMQDVRREIDLRIGDDRPAHERLLATISEMKADLRVMKKANLALAIQEPDADFCLSVMTMGEYKALGIE